MRISLAAIALVLTMIAAASAQISPSISVSGRLANSSTGIPLSGSFPANMSIFNGATGGSALYSTAGSISVNNGLFTTILSSVNLPFSQDYWLELRIGGETLNPRQKLTPAPYAIYANQAGGLANGVVTILGNSVGIGTASPTSQLTINADTNINNRGILLTQDSGSLTSSWYTSGGNATGIGSSQAFNIYAGGYIFPANSRIHVTSTGSVGIGTIVPSTTLEVLGTAKFGNRANVGEDVYAAFVSVTGGETDNCNADATAAYTCGINETKSCLDISGPQKRNVTCSIGTAGITVNSKGNVDVGGIIKANNIGTIYTRWGRDDCPAGTTLVYDGIAGGAWYQHGGSGSSLLCLAKNVTWDSYNDGNQNGALLYGTEYETNTNQIPDLTPLHDLQVPCAVCLVDNATNTLMYPGSNICPGGWNRQYYGYLMAEHYTHGKGDWVCVDKFAEGINETPLVNNNGNLLYPTEAECYQDSLACPPYVNDREVTCSVCTR